MLNAGSAILPILKKKVGKSFFFADAISVLETMSGSGKLTQLRFSVGKIHQLIHELLSKFLTVIKD